MKNTHLLPPIMLALSLVLMATLSSAVETGQGSPGSRVVTVKIKDLKFTPSDMVVSVGTAINWVNLDAVDHDVTSGVSVIGRATRGMKQTKFPDDKFSSGLFSEDKMFSVTFDKKGEYKYYCSIHPFMIAKIVVE